MKKAHTLLFFSFIINFAIGQQRWNVERTSGPSKPVSFTTDEGTWMNLDVSPDGKDIVFDLLGDIYKMPLTGGRATVLSAGAAYETQPRFSPNGKYISYTSDKEGGDNIWIMNTDGSGKRAITKENFRLLNNASWTPDNQYIIARKHFTSTRSLGAGEMWQYHIGGGEGIQLTKRKNNQQDAGEPEVSPDGKLVYYSEDVSPGPFFKYNKDPNGEIYAIKSLNRETGEIETVAGGQGGAARPEISPDGKLMAFVKRVRLKSVLFIQDLATGEEWAVYDDLSRDQQETWAIFGVYPNFAWTPDSKNIIFYAKGKIRNLDITTQEASIIPFEVTSTHTITEALHFDQKVFTDEFRVKMIRQLTTSPDGKKVAFNAAGYIYLKDLPNGKPERITNTLDFEFEPEFSPDGKFLIYVNWSDEYKGSINRYDIAAKTVSTLSIEKGFYYSPRFSAKGDKIVYRKGTGNMMLGFNYGKNPGIYIMPSTGGQAVKVSNEGIKPSFNASDNRIYFQDVEGEKKAFRSMDLTGGDIRTHYVSQYATQFAPSPDGKWLAFTELFNAYLTPMVNTNNSLELSSSNKALPLSKVTRDAGTYLHWSRDSKKLNWILGSEYFSQDIKGIFSFAEGANTTAIAADSAGTELGLKLKSSLPEGIIALTNARIITMKGDQVIENGTIVINQNKIAAIGTANQVKIPDEAKVISVENQTIMPGIVDVHGHLPISPDGISPQADWAYYTNLAYGVTTVQDPSRNTDLVFSKS